MLSALLENGANPHRFKNSLKPDSYLQRHGLGESLLTQKGKEHGILYGQTVLEETEFSINNYGLIKNIQHKSTTPL